MKVSKNAINQFRIICKGEKDSSKEDITYKLNRDFYLGEYRNIFGNEDEVRSFGSLFISCEKGVIMSVWQDKNNGSTVNLYSKYTYDFINKGSEFANAKYSKHN